MGLEVQTSRNCLLSNGSFLLTSVVQGSAACPHRLVLCFKRKEGNGAKIAGIPHLHFLSLAHVRQTCYGMNDVIRHVGSIFCVNKFVALVTFAGRNIINRVSGGEERQNKLYFPL